MAVPILQRHFLGLPFFWNLFISILYKCCVRCILLGFMVPLTARSFRLFLMTLFRIPFRLEHLLNILKNLIFLACNLLLYFLDVVQGSRLCRITRGTSLHQPSTSFYITLALLLSGLLITTDGLNFPNFIFNIRVSIITNPGKIIKVRHLFNNFIVYEKLDVLGFFP